MKDFGRRLYVTGVSADTQVDDLRALFVKYTRIEPANINRVDLNTALPAFVIQFDALRDGELQRISSRLNSMYWRGKEIHVHVI
jgi:hypothetical protein